MLRWFTRCALFVSFLLAAGAAADPAAAQGTATVSGRVTQAGTSTGIENVRIAMRNADASLTFWAGSDATGNYTFTDIPAGTYFAGTEGAGQYLDELYNEIPCPGATCDYRTGAPIVVGDGATVVGINFTLTLGGRITGQITAVGGATIGSSWVEVFKADNTWSSGYTLGARPDYQTVGLPPGQYYIRTRNNEQFVNEVYNDVTCMGCDPRMGTLVTVTAGADTSDINFQLSPGGSIAGTITGPGGVPLPNIGVSVVDGSGNGVSWGGTDNNGNYLTGDGLLQGPSYYIRTNNGQGYIDELYNNITCLNCDPRSGTAVTVTGTATTGGINFQLAAGGTITGHILEAGTGAVIPGAHIEVFDAQGRWVNWWGTDPLGTFTAPGLPTGTYYVRSWNAAGYINEAWNNIVCRNCDLLSTTPIAVVAGATTMGVGLDLERGASLSGRITDGTGNPVTTGWVWVEAADGTWMTDSSTDTAGNFHTQGGLPPGTYYLKTGNNQGLLNEIWNNVPCALGCSPTIGTPIVIAGPADLTGYDFQLDTGGIIFGHVQPAGGGWINSIGVEVFAADGRHVGTFWTAGQGDYSTSAGLPTGTYYVRTSNNDGWLDQLHSGHTCVMGNCDPRTGSAVGVTTGAATAVNFDLTRGAQITGTVTHAVTGLPLGGVQVGITDGTGQMLGWTGTNGAGIFSTAGLPGGSYYLRTNNSQGLLNEAWDNVPCLGCPWNTGTAIPLEAGELATGKNFALAPGPRIRGRVTNHAGAGLAGIPIVIYDVSGQIIASANTDAGGHYVSDAALPDGTYYALINRNAAYIQELYDNVPCPFGCSHLSGTPITVAAPDDTTGIDFTLQEGGVISGTVTDTGGAPLANVWVHIHTADNREVESVMTAADGTYATPGGLPTGTYYARTTNEAGYIDEVYGGQMCIFGCDARVGDPIVVAAGLATTPNVNFQLAAGGYITGSVTDTTNGQPVTNLQVEIVDATGQHLGSVRPGSDGIYRTPGLLGGTYYARTYNWEGYVNKIWNNKVCAGCPYTDGDPIVVPDTGSVTGIDFAVTPGPRVRGRITDAGGNPLPNVNVQIVNSVGPYVSDAWTDQSGDYVSYNGLPNGTYYVRTDARGQFLDELYNNLPCHFGCTVTSGTPVVIAGGADATSIDFVLSPGGRITGRVTDAGGNGIAGAWVDVHDASNNYLGGTPQTNTTGTYQTRALPPGTYYLRTWNTGAWINEIYNNLPSNLDTNAGTGVAIVGTADTTGVDFQLDPGGQIAGRFTNAGNGAGIGSNIWINPFRASGEGYWVGTRVNPDGTYITEGGLPPGTYYVNTDNGQGFIDELYDNLPDTTPVTSGTPVPVSAGTVTNGINFALQVGARIEGLITDAGGTPLANIWTQYWDPTQGYWRGGSHTGADGRYSIQGLPAGTYYVRTQNSPDYVDEVWDNVTCLQCSQTLGTPIVLAAGETRGNIDFALATGRHITGTVTDASGGAGIAGAWVDVYSAASQWLGSSNGQTDASGVYTTRALPPGTYYLKTNSETPYINELYNNFTGCRPETTGTPVVLGAGADTTGINFPLTRGGQIAGRFTASATGLPITNDIWVNVHGGPGNEWICNWNWWMTGDGHWITGGLPAGVYQVQTNNYGGWADEWYDNLPVWVDWSGATPITVTNGATTPNINFALDTGARLEGTVTAQATGLPLADVDVSARTASGGWAGGGRTDSLGRFNFAVPGGTYYIRTSNNLGYLDEAWDNVPCFNCANGTGTPLTVTAGQTRTGLDFALVKGARIAGRITAAATGDPVARVWVDLHDASGNWIGSSGQSDATGHYASTGLPPGTYYARTNNNDQYINETYNNLPSWTNTTSGTSIVVSGTTDVEGIDFALDLGGRVTGQVVDAGTGLPLANIRVNVWDSAGHGFGGWNTDGSGVYTTGSGLPSGNIFLRAIGGLNYITEQYNDNPCPGGTCSSTSGTPVAVTGGNTVVGINFGLTAAGKITGRVFDQATDAGLANVNVYAYTSSNSQVGSATTDATGVYTIGGLGTGTFYLRTANGLGYLDELYNNNPCPNGTCTYNTGQGVNVTAGLTTTGIHFGLVVGARITGRVVADAGGAGLGGVSVRIHNGTNQQIGSATTAADGTYTVGGLPGGTFYARTINSAGYIDELYNGFLCPNGACTFNTGTGIVVASGGTTANVDFGLATGGSLGGTVTDQSTGLPLVGVTVRVYNSSNSQMGTANTNASGAYAVTGLPTGTHYARTSNGLGYVDELYNNLPCPNQSCTTNTGTGIGVTAGSPTTGINFALDAGARITGTVTDANGGAPLANVTVRVYNTSGTQVGQTNTNGAGAYTVSGLPGGSFFARTQNSAGYIDELFDNLPCPAGVCTYTTGTPIVLAGGGVTVADFALQLGGRVTGTVTDANGGAALANVSVSLLDAYWNQIGSSTTNSSGVYTAAGLPTGSYYLATSNSLGYTDELYDNVPCFNWTCTIPGGTPIAVTAGATVSDINVALTMGARLNVTVTDQTSGAGIPSVSVRLYNPQGYQVFSRNTDASGNVSIPGVPAGSYFLRTLNSRGYIDEFWDDRIQVFTTVLNSTPYVVPGPGTYPITWPLASGGRISGRVTDGAGNPIAGVSVNAFWPTGSSFSGGTTDAGGNYTTGAGLPSGTYFARTSNGLGYQNEIYNDLPAGLLSPTSGTPITVTAPSTTPNVNFSLVPGGSITGTVTNAAGGAPLNGVRVTVYYANGTGAAGSVLTNASGMYTLGGLAAGDYFARTVNAFGFLDKLYNNITCLNCPITSGQPIHVTVGAASTGIDFALEAAPAPTHDSCANAKDIAANPYQDIVSVVNAPPAPGDPIQSCGGGQPLSNVWYTFTAPTDGVLRVHTLGSTYDTVISLYLGSCGNFGSEYACWDDVYSPTTQAPSTEIHDFMVLAGTTYLIQVAGYNWTPQQGTLIFNAEFLPGGFLSGRVTAADGITGLAGITVNFVDARGRAQGNLVTDASGNFNVGPGPAGTYFAVTSNTLGYVNQVYDHQACVPFRTLACNPLKGTPFEIPSGGTTANVNFSLDVGGRISGRVTDQVTGAPVAGATVRLVDASGLVKATGSTNGAGEYTTSGGVPPGTYYALTQDNSLGYVDQAWNMTTSCLGLPGCLTAPTPITIAAGGTVTGIDFALAIGGRVQGVATDAASGLPVSGVIVFIVDAAGNERGRGTTGSAGNYFVTKGLAPGTYYAYTDNTAGYINQLYDAKACEAMLCGPTGGTPITVTAGAVTAGINFSMTAGHRISGMLEDAGTGAPIGGMEVQFFNSTGVLVGIAASDPAGVFLSDEGFPAGTYYAKTSAMPGYAAQLFVNRPCPGGTCDPTTGDGIVLPPAGAPAGKKTEDRRQKTAATRAHAGTVSGEATANDIDFSLTACPAVTLGPASLPAASVNRPFNQTLSAAGAGAPVTFTAATPWYYRSFRQGGGLLPPGLALATTGVLSGTPTRAGEYSFLVGAVGADGCGGLQLFTIVIGEAPPAPAVTGIVPAIGPMAGGQGVTITGTGFDAGATVSLGGTAATGVAVVSPTTITAVTGARGTAGLVDVVVANVDSLTGTLRDGYRYIGSTASRTLPACYIPGLSRTVSIAVTPSAEVQFQGIEDVPPAGWTISSVSHDGSLDTATGKVKWGPFVDHTARTLTYQATPPAGAAGAPTWSGLASFDGYDLVIGGQTTIGLCEAHPADTNANFTMVVGEVTGYGAAWKRGDPWPVPPSPIPIEYVTRAGYLWRAGEAYRRDDGPCPLCWVSVALGARPVQAGEAGGSAARTLPAGYMPGAPSPVSIAVTPNAGTLSHALEETPPAGWTISDISDGGSVDAVSGAIKWLFFDGTARTLTYLATPPADAAGDYPFAGVASFDGVNAVIGGASTLGFLPDPTVTDVSPAQGPTAGGTPVTITGTTFLAGATVAFGGVPATGVLVVDATTITAVTPAHAAGAVTVLVTNTTGQTGDLPGGFTYQSALPDLLVSGTTGVPASSGPGASFTATVSTRNAGAGEAPASLTRLYLSLDRIPGDGDLLLGEHQVPALAAGATNAGPIIVNIPPAQPPAAYYLLAVADDLLEVLESRETNNVYVKPLRVQTNLVVSVLAAPTGASPGDVMTVAETTKCMGPGPALASTTSYYLSANATWDAGDRLLASRAVPPLAKGASSAVSFGVPIPADVAPGSYYLIAKADADGAVPESNEADNARADAIKLGSDLQLAVLRAAASVLVGGTVTVTDTTKNLGPGATPASRTLFYLSIDNKLDAGDVLLGARDVGPLADHASSTAATPLVIPGGTAKRKYFILAVADGDLAIAELNEANNVKTKGVTVK